MASRFRTLPALSFLRKFSTLVLLLLNAVTLTYCSWFNASEPILEETAVVTQKLNQTAEPSPEPQANLNPSSGYYWALIGNDGKHLGQERAAGIQAKLFSLSWREFNIREGVIDPTFVEQKQAELDQLRSYGFGIILSLGLQDTPAWLHDNYSDTYYINQFGDRYTSDGEIDSGDANLVFNPMLRLLAETYIQDIFATFGTDFAAVRLGGGRYGELTYPPAEYKGNDNCYWAFDRNAVTQSPTADWIPGQVSSKGEAIRFLDWYLDALVEYQNWQITTVRRIYNGPLMILYPSWGIRPGDISRALENNLDGSSAAERNGEIQRGFDFYRQITAITDPGVIVTTTWLDADAFADGGDDPRFWSPVKYLSTLAKDHPFDLEMFGENTGKGMLEDMRLSALQMERYHLIGMAWYREEELLSGNYATLDDYERIIAEFENRQ
jgi:hypothetical protein